MYYNLIARQRGFGHRSRKFMENFNVLVVSLILLCRPARRISQLIWNFILKSLSNIVLFCTFHCSSKNILMVIELIEIIENWSISRSDWRRNTKENYVVWYRYITDTFHIKNGLLTERDYCIYPISVFFFFHAITLAIMLLEILNFLVLILLRRCSLCLSPEQYLSGIHSGSKYNCREKESCTTSIGSRDLSKRGEAASWIKKEGKKKKKSSTNEKLRYRKIRFRGKSLTFTGGFWLFLWPSTIKNLQKRIQSINSSTNRKIRYKRMSKLSSFLSLE